MSLADDPQIAQSIKTAGQAVIEENPNWLLHIPEVRSFVSKEYVKSNITNVMTHSQDGSQTSSRGGTVAHNLAGLQDLAGFDRGANLATQTIHCGQQELFSSYRILHIGPRNINELFVPIANGFDPKNVHAVDLLSVHPQVTTGDMHALPFEDAFFDIIVLGWVLAYSRKPIAVLNEVSRVARDGAIIGIGWDFTGAVYQDSGLLSDFDTPVRINSTADILDLVEQSKLKRSTTLYRKEPVYPFGDTTRKAELIFQSTKFDRPIQPTATLESILVSRLGDVLRREGFHACLPRLEQHASILHGYSDATESDLKAFDASIVASRRSYGTKVDALISQTIANTFPMIYSNSRFNSNNSVYASDRSDEIEFALAGLGDRGFYTFAQALPPIVISSLRESLADVSCSGSIFSQGAHDSGPSSNMARIWLEPLFVALAEQCLKTVPILEDLHINACGPHLEVNDGEPVFTRSFATAKSLRFIVLLSDVSPDESPIEVAVAANSLSKSPSMVSQQVIRRPGEFGYAVDKVGGPSGTIVVIDGDAFTHVSPIDPGSPVFICLGYSNTVSGLEPIDVASMFFLPEYRQLYDFLPRMFMRFQCMGSNFN